MAVGFACCCFVFVFLFVRLFVLFDAVQSFLELGSWLQSLFHMTHWPRAGLERGAGDRVQLSQQASVDGGEKGICLAGAPAQPLCIHRCTRLV